MTELGFLLDLLLEHKLPVPTRKAVTARIKEVEARLASGHAPVLRSTPMLAAPSVVPPHMAGQSPSTIAAMMRHEANGVQIGTIVPPLMAPEHPPSPLLEPQPVAIIAQTPQAAAAMVARQEAIGIGISGKPAKGETRPRKW